MKPRMASGTHFHASFAPKETPKFLQSMEGPFAGQKRGNPDIRQGGLYVLELQKREAQLLQREVLRLCSDLEIWVRGHCAF